MNKLHVILSETSHAGNIGAVARAMHVCGLSQLHLINPQTEVSKDSYDRATYHAKKILDGLTHHETVESVNDVCDIVYAFTNRDRDISLPALSLSEAASEITQYSHTQIGLLFGPERTGLTNHDLNYANRCVYIPCSNENTSMNLSHAVQTALYVLTLPESQPIDVQWPTGKQKESFWNFFNQALIDSGFYQAGRRRVTEQKIRAVLNRSRLSADELQLLHGIIAAIQQKTQS